ncbi:hypothetical protein FHS15_005739, partial [Paenibacillus castaneae]|nr:hypothetical protein [Paenibacillus castaneae]
MLEQAANLSSSPVGRALQHIQAHHAYKKDNERGWIAICKKLVEPDIGADLRPRFFKTRHHLLNKITEDVIAEHMDGNLYMSQNTFWIPHRKVDNIRQLRALYVDLDCYNMGIEPKQASAMLKPLIKQGAFPMPNRITFSGQGLVLTWDIEPAAYRELPLWQTLIHYLVNVLKPYGSDVHATDAARVFRVDGSTNYKNDSQVQVEYVH